MQRTSFKKIFVEINQALRASSLTFEALSAFEFDQAPINVISLGKASQEMFKGIPDYFYNKSKASFIVSPFKLDNSLQTPTKKIQHFQGEHPYPSEGSYQAGEQILAFIDNLESNSNLLILISGGTSSLLALPADGITREEKTLCHKTLIHSGLAIDEINIVRRHISKIKGGNLLKKISRKRIKSLTLAISDVPNDHPWDIGSGPFSVDPTSFKNAFEIAKNISNFPKNALNFLEIKMNESPKASTKNSLFDSTNHSFKVILNKTLGFEKIMAVLKNHGTISSQPLDHKTWEVWLQDLTSYFKKDFWYVILGEKEIKLPPEVVSARGGRISHLLAQVALKIKKKQKFDLIGIATDGNDGNSNSSGCFISSEILEQRELQTALTQGIKAFNTAEQLEKFDLLFPKERSNSNIGDIFLFRIR